MRGMNRGILGLGVAGALMLAPLAATTASSVSASPAKGKATSLSLSQVEARVNHLRGAAPMKHRSDPSPSAMAKAGISASFVYSGNWAGYADVGHAYSNLNSRWKVPRTTCLSESYDVFWVGIDGYSNGSVEQDGTGAYCQGAGYAPYYFAWWEMYPQNYVQISFLVKPGDRISAGVKYLGRNRYWLQVIDSTNGKKLSVTPYKSGAYSTRSSAEWIAEAPSGSSGQYNLAKFANVEFAYDNAWSGTTLHYAKNWPHYAIVMWPYHETANPSNFNSAGNAFTVYWRNQY